MKSIKSKLLVVVISALFVITAIVSYIAVSMTHEIMHRDADRILSNVTLKEAAYINDTLGDVVQAAAIMEHYVCADVKTTDQLSDAEFISAYLDKAQQMFSEVALNTSGIEGFFLRINPQHATNTTGFYCQITDTSTVQSMPITDLSRYPENDINNVGWYYTPLNEGTAVWFDPYDYPGNDNRLISYAVPLYIGTEVLGVLGFDMNFQYLIQKIEGISVYEKGYAVLLSGDAQTPYSTVPAVNSSDPHTTASASLINGMRLELRADYKDIQRDIHPMLNTIVLAFVIVLALSILYTVFVTHRIVHPLKQLTAAAQEIASGKNDTVVVPIESKDEIGTLSRVLSTTYGKIMEYTSYINALAYRDSLTGIKNSTAYTEAIADINQEINCNNPRFGVLVADINNLKETNDKYGHDIGNELIIHTSRILTDIFKNSLVFRIGGDEFAIILKGNDYDDYRPLLVQLDGACSTDYVTVRDERVPVSVARGVALFHPEIDNVYEDVFTKADHAMYLNKTERKTVTV